MGDLATIKTADIAELQNKPAITQAEVEGSAHAAGVDLNLWLNQEKLGRFLASGAGGHIITQSALFYKEAQRLRDALLEIVEQDASDSPSEDERSTVAAQKIAAINGWSALIKTLTERDVLNLKAAEVISKGVKGKTAEGHAPDLNIDTAYIQIAPQK
jgi:hypothetical protein